MSRRKGTYLPWGSNREKESYITDFRLAKGMYLRELAELTGLRLTDITNLASGMASPLVSRGLSKGEVRPEVVKLCKILDTTPEEVFPRYLCKIEASKTLPEGFLTGISHSSYSQRVAQSVEQQYEIHDFIHKLVKIGILSKLQLGVLLARHEGLTLEEIGIELGVTREHIRQMEYYTMGVIQKWLVTGKPPKSRRYKGDYEYIFQAQAEKRNNWRRKKKPVVHRVGCAPVVGTKRGRGRPKKGTP